MVSFVQNSKLPITAPTVASFMVYHSTNQLFCQLTCCQNRRACMPWTVCRLNQNLFMFNINLYPAKLLDMHYC